MKKLFLSLVLVASYTFTYSQGNQDLDNTYASADTYTPNTEINSEPEVLNRLPQFPGGIHALKDFLEENVEYPVQAQENGIQGVVKVQLIVAEDGSLTVDKIVSQGHPMLEKAAMDAVKEMPNWEPSLQNGETVVRKVRFPIVFKL